MRGQAQTDVDVLILGGGPAGSATALSLAQAGITRVLLVEMTRYREIRIGESVPPDIRTPLDRLGLWDAFVAEEHDPCLGSCSAWGTDALGYNDFLLNPLGHGWHLDRTRFDEFLARKAAERGAELSRGMRFKAAERLAQDGFRLQLVGESGRIRTVTARFVVDATGTRSSFARSMGAHRLFVDQLLCVTAFFRLPDAAQISRLTMLEAVEYGWWYAARLPHSRLAVAVASDPQIVKQIALHRREPWLERLAATSHIAVALSGCRLIADAQVICAAPSFMLSTVAGDRWLAVGDAASAFDPISSQGIHKALTDGACAGKAIADHLYGDDHGLREHQSSVATRHRHYLDSRNYFYSLERRWPQSTFWTTRRARARLRTECASPVAARSQFEQDVAAKPFAVAT
jgi:flavin-dependent dehydrogenase